MKKLLYGSTALLAAGVLASSADAAERIKLGVGGYFTAGMGYADQDDGAGEPGANRRDHFVFREAEIHFEGKTTLDNGIEFGVNIQLEGESETEAADGGADQIDESYIWIEGGFGRINLGSENSAAYLMSYGLPTLSNGSLILRSNDPNYRFVNAPAGHAAAGPFSVINITNDSEKITYFTPRIAGFQLGLSYTPDNCEEVSAGAVRPCGGTFNLPQADNTVGQQSEVFEAGINFVQKFGDVSVAVYGAYGVASLEQAAAAPAGADALDDQEEWGIGANIGFMGFVLGGAYTDRDDFTAIAGAAADRKDWNLGLSYSTGPWGLQLTWEHAEVDVSGQAGEDETDVIALGVTYALGPGVSLVGSLEHWDFDSDRAGVGDGDATAVIIGTQLAF